MTIVHSLATRPPLDVYFLGDSLWAIRSDLASPRCGSILDSAEYAGVCSIAEVRSGSDRITGIDLFLDNVVEHPMGVSEFLLFRVSIHDV